LLPEEYWQTNYQQQREDLVPIFINEEYTPFPVMFHDDMLDSLARILDDDMRLTFPLPNDDDYEYHEPERGFAYG